jgi:hypothetical protein
MDGTTWSTVDLSNGLWNRIVLSATLTNPVVGIRLATSGDAVAMDFGQIEAGAFVTSPILTTTASVTRSADVTSISQNFVGWFNYDKGTILCNYNILGISSEHYLWGFNRGTTRLIDCRTSNAINFSIVGVAAVTTGLGVRNINKTGFSYSNFGVISNCVNGINPADSISQFTATQLNLVPQQNINVLFIGSTPTGYISRIVYLPIKSTAKALQELTQ